MGSIRRQSGLEVVGSFTYLHEADVAKALLDSEGIRAWIFDELQVQMRWHLSAALGGVKVAVSPSDAERARELLATDHSDALAEIAEQALPAHPAEACPHCGEPASGEARRQRLPGPLQWLVSLAFLPTGVLFPRRRFVTRRECAACGNHWSRRESG